MLLIGERQAGEKNKQALSLVWAMLAESLERRFGQAFGIAQTEIERNELLNQRILELKAISARLSGWSEIRIERNYYKHLLRENGINPWKLPGVGDESG